MKNPRLSFVRVAVLLVVWAFVFLVISWGATARGTPQSVISTAAGEGASAAAPTERSGFADFALVNGLANLSLTKSASPEVVLAGQSITYTLVFSNAGPAIATAVVITDVVPITVANVSCVSSGALITPTGSVSYTWQVADLAPGEGGVITITGVISTAQTTSHSFVNTAAITSTVEDSDTTNNSSSATVFVRARPGQLYPAGSTLVPLGADQSQLRHAYQDLFDAYSRQPVAWTAAPSTYTIAYAPGTQVGLRGLYGDYDRTHTDGTYTVRRAHVLYPADIALFYSDVRDAANQVVTWEEATFETLFRVYLWGDYFETVSEADIIAGDLADYDILILPSITIGYADDVADALGTDGLTAIADWVAAGGTLYAQGDGCHLVEAAGLVVTGTVNLDDRLTDEAPFDNVAHLRVDDPDSSLTFSWLAPETYILDDPVLTATIGISVVATYTDTTRPDTPAILFARREDGQVILTNAHPSVRQSTYPLALDAILLGMSERCGMSGRVKQEFSPAVADHIIPAYEADIPVRVTTEVRDYWDLDATDVTITESVRSRFTVSLGDIVPPPASLVTDTAGTTIVWHTAAITPGVTTFEYVARTLTDTMASGWATVSTAEATYVDPLTERSRYITRNAVYVKAQMAARLNGDRDIELDGLYPLPAEGAYFDIALTLENKEETAAQSIVITDVVALLSPLVDVDDQRIIPTVLTDTITMTSTDETIWVANEVFFYHNANYPLPEGVASNTEVFNLDNWDGVTVYTYTNTLSNTVTIPITYTAYISVTADGQIRLPAAVMTWDFGDLQGYDYLDPAVRYGIFSQELLERQVSFASDPMSDTGVVMNGSGGSVFTNLGGHPIPYHEYLSSGIITIPEPPVSSTVAYQDIWERPNNMDLRTVFYDIVPFPPPEYHAVVNTTFEMNVDWDGDGQRTDRVLEYPSRVPADLHLMLKSHSNFDPLLPPLRQDETLLSQGMFKGLGFTISPGDGAWEDSWSFRDLQGKGPHATVLTDVIDTPAYTYLYFQQELDSQAYEVVDITGTLDASMGHREGVMKVNDGARFVYHQKAVGPSRYEVFDSHVQAVFGLRSDAQVSKRVAPVRVATYDDSVYHFIEMEDPWEPRSFSEDPFIQSYGFGDMAATVYVGGRHQRELLWSRVNPGGDTQVRVEINNNTGLTLTNVSLAPSATPGISVTLRTYTETTEIEPLFFDFPFLNAEDIWDAWKGVYYFNVEVDDPFPGERGQVYPITFTLTGDNVPADFLIPPAQLGIKDAAGGVSTTFGPATDLVLADRLPPWVTLRDARIANTVEMAALVDAINYDDAHPGSDTAGALYATFRDGITTSTVTSTAGADVTFTLPPYAQVMPWLDEGEPTRTLYVIAYSDLAIDWSGTATADHAPVITYTDHFSQTQTDTGNAETVEAHGAALSVTYTVRAISSTGQLISAPIPANVRSDLLVEGTLVNGGDDIAADTLISYTIPTDATPVGAAPAWQDVSDDAITWSLGDLGPGVRRTLWVTLAVTPTAEQIGTDRPLINGADSQFLNIYAQRAVDAHIGDELTIGVEGVPDLVITKTAVPPGESPTTHGRVAPGNDMTYVLAFSNDGSDVATGVVITDVAPISITVNSVVSSGVAITDTGVSPAYVWQVADLAPGEGGAITISGVVSPTITGVSGMINQATIKGVELDENPNDNTSVVSHTIDAEPPDPPTLGSPANGAVLGYATPTLTWQPSPSTDVAGYLLDWGGGAQSGGDVTLDVGNVTQYTLGPLANGIYTWTVAAYDLVRNTSPYTDTWSFTVDAPLVPIGGYAVPVNRWELLKTWIVLIAGVVIIIGVVMVRKPGSRW